MSCALGRTRIITEQKSIKGMVTLKFHESFRICYMAISLIALNVNVFVIRYHYLFLTLYLVSQLQDGAHCFGIPSVTPAYQGCEYWVLLPKGASIVAPMSSVPLFAYYQYSIPLCWKVPSFSTPGRPGRKVAETGIPVPYTHIQNLSEGVISSLMHRVSC